MNVAATILNSSARFADGKFTLPFQEGLDYLRQKVSLPSKSFRDLTGRAHDRGFVVAGATKEALIEDLRKAVDGAIANGLTPAQFHEQFESIVAKQGWTGWTGEDTREGRAWRSRVIYETNLRTAYAAGRYQQMTDPDLVKVRPYWRYRHGFHRIPGRARPQHRAWDMLCLAWDDPFWQTHYPPNGWMCSCGVETLSRRDLERLGKMAPDKAPVITTINVKDPATGEWIKLPESVDLGWDHAPGRDWAKGLVPRELQKPLEPSGFIRAKQLLNLPPLADIAKPVKAKMLPEGQSDESYIDAFLSAFGAARDAARVVRDASGQAIVISQDLFRRGDGSLKVTKRGRGAAFLRLAEALLDPDEIWVDWAGLASGGYRLVRRYLRYDPESMGFSIFEWTPKGWSGVTTFDPRSGSRDKPNAGYLEKQRSGALLYRREK